MTDDRIPERDLGIVAPSSTDMVRLLRNGRSVMGPVLDLPPPAATAAIVAIERDARLNGDAALQSQVSDLRASQGTGLPGYETIADLPDLAVEDEGQMAWVANDPVPVNNGAWRWSGSSWVKSADQTTELAAAIETKLPTEVFDQHWAAPNVVLRAIDPWTGYVFGLTGLDFSPWAIQVDGTVRQPKVELESINDIGFERGDTWTGFAFGVKGKDGLWPWGIQADGTVRQQKLSANYLNGIAIDEMNVGGARVHIKQATQEWWICPVHTHLSSPYERIVSGAYSEKRGILVSEYIPAVGTIKRIELTKTELWDDHNSPSLWAEEGRRMLAAWTEHNNTNAIHLRVSNQVGELESFLENPIVEFDYGSITTYTQVFKIRHLSDANSDVLWVFTRVNNTWRIKQVGIDQETGALDLSTAPWTFILQSGQYYISVAEAFRSGNQVLRVAGYLNPAEATNAIHYFELDCVTGDISSVEEGHLANLFAGTGMPVNPDIRTPMLPTSDPSIDRRMHYVRPGPIAPAILFAEWPLSDPDEAVYKVAVLDEGAGTWSVRDHGPSGSRVGYTSASNYIAGGSFPAPCHSDVLLIGRHDDATDTSFLEEHRTISGSTEVRELARVERARITRPMVPIGDGSPLVTFSEVTYYGKTDFDFNATIKSAFRRSGT